MLDDLVVDTNVLVHADNPAEDRHADAVELLNILLEGSTSLCVDEGFDSVESADRSLIVGEYREHLTPVATGMQVLAHLARTGRVKIVPRTAPVAVRKQINQMIRDKRDRTFLVVAHNSSERVLCSHDYVDLASDKRKALRKSIVGVSVEEACDVVPSL